MNSLKWKKRVQQKIICQECLKMDEYKYWLKSVTSDPTKFKCIDVTPYLHVGKVS